MAGVTTTIDLGAPLKASLSIRDRINKGEVVGTRTFVSGPWIARLTGAGGHRRHAGWLRRPEHLVVRGSRTRSRPTRRGRRRSHQGARRPDARGLQGDRRSRAQASAARLRARLCGARTSATRSRPASTCCSTPDPPARRRPYSKELITDIVNAGRPVVVTAAHRAWVYPDTAAFPGAAAGSGSEEGVRTRHLRGSAGLAQELVDARLLPADRSRDALPRARRQAVHRIRRGDGHGHRFGHADEFSQRGALAGDQGPRRHGHDADRVRSRRRRASTRRSSARRATSGSIEPGKIADIIVVNGNPLFDITALSHVEVVVKDGVVYKGGPAAEPKPRDRTP